MQTIWSMKTKTNDECSSVNTISSRSIVASATASLHTLDEEVLPFLSLLSFGRSRVCTTVRFFHTLHYQLDLRRLTHVLSVAAPDNFDSEAYFFYARLFFLWSLLLAPDEKEMRNDTEKFDTVFFFFRYTESPLPKPLSINYATPRYPWYTKNK